MKIKAFKFDKAANEDKNSTEAAQQINMTPKRVNVDFPIWMVASLDMEAKRIGITRQSLIKLWIADKLEQQSSINNS